MKQSFKVTFLVLIFLGLAALAALFIGTHRLTILEPTGLIALKERELIITAALLMLIVVIPVFILTLVIAYRYRASNEKAQHAPDWEHNTIAEVCWWGVPLIIIMILGVITWKTSHELNPFNPIENGKKPVVIQVVALDWKWLFIYPEEGIAVVNFTQFPDNTPINFEITADAPMNSFWIPSLGGQIYAMPAMRTKLHLVANEIGEFRGVSSNISGKGFAGMMFTAKASSDSEFHKWASSVRRSSKTLTMAEYLKLVEPSEYDPVTTYVLKDKDLFDKIIEQYTAPKK